MPRLGEIRPLPEVGDDQNPAALTRFARRYLGHLRAIGRSEGAIKNARISLRIFLQWCDVRGLGELSELTLPVLEAYQRYLAHRPKLDGNPLAVSTQREWFTGVRNLLRYAVKHQLLAFNPSLEIELPKAPKRLPADILSTEELERIFAEPDISKPEGLRNRAILETIYSTGIRRAEVTGLRIQNVDYERGTLMVRQGKGKKDRVVPIGERALSWLNRYLCEVRVKWAPMADEEKSLFISHTGASLSPEYLTHRMRRIFNAAGIEKPGSCHLLRHTAATVMLENGADIRYIQAMLGHENLETTRIYTRVSIGALKEVHQRTHPLG